MSARSRIATRRAAAELAGHRRRLLECSVDPDLDPSAALLLRVGPATELRLDQAIGHNGQDDAIEGHAAHREGLWRLRAAALSVGEESHLSLSKNPAPGSRPPASQPNLRLTSSAPGLSAGRAGQDAPSTTPPGRGADVTQNQEESN